MEIYFFRYGQFTDGARDLADVLDAKLVDIPKIAAFWNRVFTMVRTDTPTEGITGAGMESAV